MKRTIGIDASPLLDGNRLRGVGMVLRRSLEEMPKKLIKDCLFVVYVRPDDYEEDAMSELIAILESIKITYRVEDLKPFKKEKYVPDIPKVRRVVNLVLGSFNRFFFKKLSLEYRSVKCDEFIQVDVNRGLPSRLIYKGKSKLIIHDLIPKILEADYLPGYHLSRSYGMGLKRSLKNGLKRRSYIKHMKTSVRRASIVYCDSENTLKDVLSLSPKDAQKLTVNYLGADDLLLDEKISSSDELVVSTLRSTEWGAMPDSVKIISTSRFILYVGGADPRKNIKDVLATYNLLRSQGHNEYSLILCGDTLTGPDTIPNAHLTTFISQNSSYLGGVKFLGHVSQVEKLWLYENAHCLLLPTKYEGFGLTNLEAMKHSCPVITYDNSCVRECCGDAALYASSPQDMTNLIVKLESILVRKKMQKLGEAQSKKYTWRKSSSVLFS